MTTPRHKVQSAIEVYLDSLNVILYLNWDVTKEDSKAEAVEYLTDLWLKIEAQMETQFPPPEPQLPYNWQDEAVLAKAYDLNQNRPLTEREAAMQRHPSYVPHPHDVNL
jgi:hypothetical protein